LFRTPSKKVLLGRVCPDQTYIPTNREEEKRNMKKQNKTKQSNYNFFLKVKFCLEQLPVVNAMRRGEGVRAKHSMS